MAVVDIGILMRKSIGILFFVQMCLPKSGLELEGDPALINFPLKSICANNWTYQTGEYQPGTGFKRVTKMQKPGNKRGAIIRLYKV